MKPHATTPTCQAETWDNTDMAEFKRLEAENPSAFGKSPEAQNGAATFMPQKQSK